ncbi:MAG: galactokinase [Acidimicrobiales bacterium]
MEARTHAVVEAFREASGGLPVGVWAAPGRVNLIGEHVDYNSGVVLPFAIEQRCIVAAAQRRDGLLVVTSLQRGQRVSVPVGDLEPSTAGEAFGEGESWAWYPAGVVWALAERCGMTGGLGGGLDLVIDSDVPVGAGLSSSAAMECGVGFALNGMYDCGIEGMELAEVCQRAENEFAGVPCGIMDQAASLLATPDHVVMLDVRSREARQVPFRPAAAGLSVMVVATGASHDLAAGAYAERRESCERAAAELGLASLRDATAGHLHEIGDDEVRKRARHVVSEMERVEQAVAALRAGDLGRLGRLMSASHESLRDDYAVSCEELDVAVDALMGSGALGARMTGAGFGGSVIGLVPTEDRAGATAAVVGAFASHGWAAPKVFFTTPARGAERVL